MTRILPRLRREDGGLSLVEAVVSIAITVTAVASAALLLSGVGSSVQATRLRDDAVAAAYGVMEQAAAFNCGLSVGNDGDPDATKQLARCRYDQTNAASASLSDLQYTTQRDRGTFTVKLATRWEIPGIQAAYITETGPLTCQTLVDYANGRRTIALGAGPAIQPTLLVRNVTVTWTQRTQRSFAISTRSAVPGDSVAFNRTEYGGIMVKVPNEGIPVRLETGGGITRYSDSGGCVWFPYLAPGAYSVAYPGGVTQVTIPATCASATPPSGFTATCQRYQDVSASYNPNSSLPSPPTTQPTTTTTLPATTTTTLPVTTTTLPAAGGFTLAAPVMAGTQAVLAWGSAGTPGAGFDGYKPSYRVLGTTTWTATTPATTTATTATITGLALSTTYEFRVVTYDAAGDDAITNVVSGATAPSAPAVTVSMTGTQATVSWSAVNTANGYRVLYKTTADTSWMSAVPATTTATSILVGGLIPATSYQFKAVAYNNAGDSTDSAVAGATTAPAAPDAPTLSAIAPTSITVNWAAAPTATSYQLYQNGGQVGPVAAGPVTRSGLTELTTYGFQIAACNAAGCSAPSTETFGTTLQAPFGEIRYSYSATRSPSWPLNGASLAANTGVYVFFQESLALSRVDFYTNDTGSGTLYKAETAGPWDMGGTATTGNAGATYLLPASFGPASVSTRSTRSADGATRLDVANFTTRAIACPQVTGATPTASTTAATSWTITLPAGVTAGDRVMLFTRGTYAPNVPNAAWTRATTYSNGGVSAVLYTTATGPMSSITLPSSSGTSARLAVVALRITGAGASQAPIGSIVAGATSGAITSPTIATDPAFGQLAIVMATTAGTLNTFNAPVGYDPPASWVASSLSTSTLSYPKVSVAVQCQQLPTESPPSWDSSGTISSPHVGTWVVYGS